MTAPDGLRSRSCAAALLQWYAGAARALPWRSRPDPYRVLLSELMLQQTRVQTALPHFERFVARWPTLESLAGASEADVVEQWAGLGYYRRARMLHRCARAAVELGGLPEDPASLRALPGIGPYTAGAVASIAFGLAEPAIDGNVERVLARLEAIEDDPKRAGRPAVERTARALLEHRPGEADPGALNQALMELGALVCLPRSPRCPECPVQDHCRAQQIGRVEALPVRRPRAAPVAISGSAGVLSRGGAVLLGRRRPEGLLGGLWEPPRVDATTDPAGVVELLGALGARARVRGVAGEVTHRFTHRLLTCTVYDVEGQGTDLRPARAYDRVAWVAAERAPGLSGLARKVLATAGTVGPCPR